MVHQVGDARDAAGGDRQLGENLGAGRRRRVDRRRSIGVGVVDEADLRPPLRRLPQRVGDDRPGRVRQPDVVERQIQAPLGCADEGCDTAGNVLGALAAVGQGEDLDQAAPGDGFG